MIEICVPTFFSESLAEWRLRDRVFAKALEFTNTGPVTHHRLILPAAILAQNFEVKQEQVTSLLAFLPWYQKIIETSKQLEGHESKNGGIHMISRLIMTVVVALFFTPAALSLPRNIRSTRTILGASKKGGNTPKKLERKNEVSTADISAGIKKNIDAESKKSS